MFIRTVDALKIIDSITSTYLSEIKDNVKLGEKLDVETLLSIGDITVQITVKSVMVLGLMEYVAKIHFTNAKTSDILTLGSNTHTNPYASITELKKCVWNSAFGDFLPPVSIE